MMPPDAVRVIAQFQDALYVDSEVKPIIRVKFMVGKFGPFSEQFDAGTFTADVRDRKLRERAEHIWVDPVTV